MIDKNILDFKEQYSKLKIQENLQELYKYYRNKKYIAILLKQYNGILKNLESINLLVSYALYEDAFTIFRKYIETYFIIISIYEHPDLAESYVEHDKYLGFKACRKNLELVKSFCSGKPEGFLEYGYLERYVDIEENFKYTTKTVAKVGNVIQFHKLYKMCNNFVHNNLTQVSLNLTDAKETIVNACEKTTKYLIDKFNVFIIKLN